MFITLVYLGQLRHIAEKAEEVFAYEEAPALLDIFKKAASQYDPAFGRILFDEQGHLRPSVMVLVNDAPVSKEVLPMTIDGDQVTLLPAIAGG